MEIIRREIARLITPDAQAVLGQWLAKCPGAEEWAEIVTRLIPCARNGTLSCGRKRLGADLSSPQYGSAELVTIQDQWDWMFKLRAFLRRYPSVAVSEPLAWRRADTSSSAFLGALAEDAESTEKSWRVVERPRAGCWWNGERQIRELGVFTEYALLHDAGPVCSFMAPEDDGWVNVMEFAVPPEQQGNWPRSLRWFRECFVLLAHRRGQLGLQSPCLVSPKDASPVRKEFRFDPIELDGEPDGWKLLKLWLMAGACRCPFKGDLRDMLYFAVPNEAQRIKQAVLAQGRPNPYRFACHSIYGPELERELRA